MTRSPNRYATTTLGGSPTRVVWWHTSHLYNPHIWKQVEGLEASVTYLPTYATTKLLGSWFISIIIKLYIMWRAAFRESSDISSPVFHAISPDSIKQRISDRPILRNWIFPEIFSCVSCDISRLVHWNFFKIPQIHCCIALKLLAKFEVNLTSRSWEIWLFMNSVPFAEIFSCVSCDISKSAHGKFIKNSVLNHYILLWLFAKFEEYLIYRFWENRLFVNSEMVRCPTSHIFWNLH